MEIKNMKSEAIGLGGYLLILGGWVFGFDIQQILLILFDVELYVKDIRALVMESANKETGIIAGGAATAIYTAARTWIKSR